eukprot:7133400-Prymnesium_polylepis.1
MRDPATLSYESFCIPYPSRLRAQPGRPSPPSGSGCGCCCCAETFALIPTKTNRYALGLPPTRAASI